MQWLRLGDKNTVFFHRSLLHRRSKNQIHSLRNEAGEEVRDPAAMGEITVDYFKGLLNTLNTTDNPSVGMYFSKTISREDGVAMAAPITREEIKDALFSIPDDKAPGPNGYNSCFFKKSWATVGDDFAAAVSYFFRTSYMPKCINTTRIALIPKVENPEHLHDYRPISCCTVIYKCISKIIAKHIQSSLASVISRSQSAFLSGRNISEAIFLVQELMHNYHRPYGSPRCAIKVDLRKAFDMI